MSQLFSLIVPLFNEAETLSFTHSTLVKTLENFPDPVEIIYVDDGSSDKTPFLLQQLVGTAKVKIRPLHFSRNFGHSAAVLAGLRHSSGTVIGIIDADLQDPPSLLKPMIEKLRAENLDIVFGKRTFRTGETLLKKTTAWAFYRVLNFLAGVHIPEDTGDFRVFTSEVKEAVLLCKEQEPFLRGLFAWVGFQAKPFEYQREERKLGATKYNYRKMMRFALNAILSFSSKPLIISVYLGIGGIIFSLLLSLYVIVGWSRGMTVPGWTSLLLVISFFESLVIFLIGIHGAYLSRMNKELLSRPHYILRKSSPV